MSRGPEKKPGGLKKRLRARPSLARDVRSPNELRTDLADAWVASVGDVSEAAAADVTARIKELRVVEDVEEFRPNLERHGFPNRNDLRDPEIGVIDPGAVKESAVRGSKASAIGSSQNPCHEVASSCGE